MGGTGSKRVQHFLRQTGRLHRKVQGHSPSCALLQKQQGMGGSRRKRALCFLRQLNWVPRKMQDHSPHMPCCERDEAQDREERAPGFPIQQERSVFFSPYPMPLHYTVKHTLGGRGREMILHLLVVVAGAGEELGASLGTPWRPVP